MHVNRPIAEALLRLRNGEEFSQLKLWLKARADTAKNQCMTQLGEQLYRAQGRAQEAQDLLNFIEEAPNLFEKVKNQK